MRSAINPKIFPPLSLFPPRISKGRPASYPANVCHSKIAFNTAMTADRTLGTEPVPKFSSAGNLGRKFLFQVPRNVDDQNPIAPLK